MATRSLSPKQILERTQLYRQAVIQFARLAAKRAVKDEMRAQGVRVTLVFPATITAKAIEYLSAHPELFDEARERAKRMGYNINDFCFANIRCDLRQSGSLLRASASTSHHDALI
jgi:hypothetical protein